MVHWKIKEITELSAGAYLMPDFLNWARFCSVLRGIS
jgi:hypothetical protein